jgi:hypothetical protein
VPSNARALYNHNETRGKRFYMFAGAKGTLFSGELPGQDDQVVAYHSTGALAGIGGYCNPLDVFCDGVLEEGTDGTCVAHYWWGGCSQYLGKWTNHTVQFRDYWESYKHLPWSTAIGMNDWGEIIGLQRQDMVNYAL